MLAQLCISSSATLIPHHGAAGPSDGGGAQRVVHVLAEDAANVLLEEDETHISMHCIAGSPMKHMFLISGRGSRSVHLWQGSSALVATMSAAQTWSGRQPEPL